VFKSKIRPIVIPQYEHGRLAGTFASLWGNQDIKRPLINFDSFVQGVTFHDWHYGVIDHLAIGESAEEDWLEIVQKGIDYWFDDPITDIIVKLHIRRLLSSQVSADRQSLIDQIEDRIAVRLPQTAVSREQFERIDRITKFCDQLAFDFCFEAPMKATLPVFTDQNASKETYIAYEIKPEGQIEISPWPFSVSGFGGFIIGYQQQNYPEILKPEMIHYHCKKIGELENFDTLPG
jgi:hypothetical protein